ncbi:hypothetical protein HPB47_002157 [Ixodes persulcatus]|uniref:Uncharacterized protein n=1 Tax=Ixodes persulcatus TaxID=34615 RepID=A0AC60PM19_IXOPE|nr:hypothetical protein HPB47_002157 [Ixodes persulcatus]
MACTGVRTAANVVALPKDDFRNIIYDSARTASYNQLVVLGDMNARHTAWGYQQDTQKGRSLLDAVDQMGLELGSDHNILSTSVSTPKLKRTIGEIRLTNWEAYRQYPPPANGITNITEWMQHLRDAHIQTTQIIQRTVETPEVDRRLLHLWEAREGLLKRWKRQRLNRKLRLRIEQITEEAKNHAAELTQQNWVQFCTSLKGTLSTAKTWAILRCLIEPDKAKSATSRTLQEIAHNFPGNDHYLINALIIRYLGSDSVRPCLLKYEGEPRPAMDAPIMEEEVYAAARASQRNTAPGADKITNAMIRNLSPTHIRDLTEYLNEELWSKGHVPKEWKHAEIVTIPKPGKKPAIDALRPISLTSCLGKLYERVIKTRLQNYIEDHDLFPHTMLGFRPGLSAQDAFLILREEVLKGIPKGGEHLLLALDLKGAFDNISHEAILKGLNTISCGERIFDYIKSFLTGRTASIGIGHTRSDKIEVPNKGTPQGAIVSPVLFNIAMLALTKELRKIPDLGYVLYADGITLWATKGSLAQKEATLQEATTAVERFAAASGMRCAPEKSEVIRVHGGGIYKSPGPIDLYLEDQKITESNKTRILGFWIQSNLKASHTIQTLRSTTNQISRIIKRITRSRKGMREEDTLRLVQALVISRVTYGMPYHHHFLSKRDQEQVDVIIRGAYKTALGLPVTTSNEKLAALGIHNTFAELSDAVLASQKAKLQNTAAGRAILHRVGAVTEFRILDGQRSLPPEVRSRIEVSPIPKHMSHELHEGRRKARVDRHRRQLNGGDNSLTLAASVRAETPAVAETIAAALVIKQQDRVGREVHVVTDSQQACRNFTNGRTPLLAARILGPRLEEYHQITWTPGHAGLEGNERANALARALTNRAGQNQSSHQSPPFTFVPLPSNYGERLEIQRLNRRIYPPPHKKLSTEDAVALILIQTNTFPNLHRYSKLYPLTHRGICPWCGDTRPTLFHISWGGGGKPQHLKTPSASFERWEVQLTGDTLAGQEALVQQRTPPSSRSTSPDPSSRGPNEDTTETRVSRRIQGLDPEYGLLPTKTKETRRTTMANQSETPAAPAVVYLPVLRRTEDTTDRLLFHVSDKEKSSWPLRIESCGQAPAWNPFAQLFAQPSALSTTEPAAESA